MKITNGSDFDLGAQKFQQIGSKGPRFSTHILGLVNDQRLKFRPIAVLGLLKTPNGLDFDFVPQNLKTKGKGGKA